MPARRGSRLLVEVFFLAALASALAFARLNLAEIVAAMAAGWVIVAAFEWAAWKAEPHFGSGLPPRYFVPATNLPAPQPLEQVGQGYPGVGREEAPTWIASAALRAEVLGEWPVAAPVEVGAGDEDDEPGFLPALEADADPWTVVSLPAAPLDVVPVEPVVELPVVEVPPVVEPPPPAPEPAQAPVRRGAADGMRLARYSLDPLADRPPPRRFRRAAVVQVESVDVPALPAHPRPLPGSVRRA